MIPKSGVTQTRPPTSARIFPLLFIAIGGVLLLGVGGSLAIASGIAIAQFYPDRTPEKPLLAEIIPRQLSRLAHRWENLVKLKSPGATIAPSPTTAESTNRDKGKPGAAGEVFAPETLRVTLLSDILFQEGSTNAKRTTQTTQLLLDNLISEVQNYPGAIVRIAGHTDDAGDANLNRDLSFERSRAVKEYLADALNKDYHWVVIGYGETRPLVENTTDINRQRNRRIEISIEPN